MMETGNRDDLLTLEDVRCHFPVRQGMLGEVRHLRAVDGSLRTGFPPSKMPMRSLYLRMRGFRSAARMIHFWRKMESMRSYTAISSAHKTGRIFVCASV